MRISVIIPTYQRPDCIRTCLERLLAQVPAPSQIIVVDASTDTRTRDVVVQFSGVTYLLHPPGRGNLPHSRNAGVLLADGDIIAFLDDDAYAHEGWARELSRSYQDPTVGAVAGRALNHQPGEETRGIDRIGRLLPGGAIEGNFAADPGRTIDVDHMIGCNMSFRRETLARLGGFRDDHPPGPFSLCEDTEICVRAKRLGYRLVFNPLAVVTHLGAPQPASTRFGVKYSYYHARNLSIMYIRNHGAAGRTWGAIGGTLARSLGGGARKIAGAVAHVAAISAGTVVGVLAGVRLRSRTGGGAACVDRKGTEITHRLSPVESADEAIAVAHEPSGSHFPGVPR